jgi:hypothetical protein
MNRLDPTLPPPARHARSDSWFGAGEQNMWKNVRDNIYLATIQR